MPRLFAQRNLLGKMKRKKRQINHVCEKNNLQNKRGKWEVKTDDRLRLGKFDLVEVLSSGNHSTLIVHVNVTEVSFGAAIVACAKPVHKRAPARQPAEQEPSPRQPDARRRRRDSDETVTLTRH